MKLREFIYASTRPAWTARLVVYVALMVTLSAFVQVLVAWLL